MSNAIPMHQWLRENCHLELPKGNINGSWFAQHNLPMVVECKCCAMTMALPSGYVDGKGSVYCAECAKGDE